jgi:tRNA(Ile)-lysidine synthase TilS/MesJ
MKKVKEFIEKEDLFSKQDKILVALSGGADSVALTRILICSLNFFSSWLFAKILTTPIVAEVP